MNNSFFCAGGHGWVCLMVGGHRWGQFNMESWRLGIVGSRFGQHGQFWVGLTHWHLSHKDNFLRTIARHGFARLGLSYTGQFARTPAWHGSIIKR